ncbi:MAG: peptidase M3A and M3B thimet/oligopeptidase F [Candidatus Eisenbacteria bacterium]|nr:peptidase M3A and M3B thimet/oligopeptidase F [Candidatus Eisenbacteria bacterium]
MSQDEQALQSLIAETTRVLEPLHREMCLAYWSASLTGSEEDAARAADLETRFRRTFASPESLERLKRWRDAGTIREPLLQRQLTLLINGHLENQMDPETLRRVVEKQRSVETTFSNHRASVGGRRLTDNQINEILKTSRDSDERRAAWEAGKSVGAAVAGEILDLVELRNSVARRLGFDDFYVMALELQEQTEGDVLGIARRFEDLSDEPFRRMRQEMDTQLAERFGLAADRLRPWHYEDPFFQEAPALEEIDLDPLFAERSLEELTETYYNGIGLPVDDIMQRSDLYERPGKNQHAYCIDIDRRGDIRVLGNIKPTSRWMSTMLHEFGHAVYDKFVDSGLPFLLRTASHSFTTEAVAMLMGRQSQEEAWLRDTLGLTPDQSRTVSGPARRQSEMQILVSTRWMLVMIHFERELYRNPDQDLAHLWWDLVEEYQMVRRPEDRRTPDWASKIHIACYPVYYHNYLWGEFMASQLRSWIDREVLAARDDTLANRPEVGAFLRAKIFAPGTSLRWDELLRQATGESLNPAHFVRQFVR